MTEGQQDAVIKSRNANELNAMAKSLENRLKTTNPMSEEKEKLSGLFKKVISQYGTSKTAEQQPEPEHTQFTRPRR